MKKLTLVFIVVLWAIALSAQITGSKIVKDFADKLEAVKLKSEEFAQNVKKNWSPELMKQDLIEAQKRYSEVRIKQISTISALQLGIRHKSSSKKMGKTLKSQFQELDEMVNRNNEWYWEVSKSKGVQLQGVVAIVAICKIICPYILKFVKEINKWTEEQREKNIKYLELYKMSDWNKF